MTEPNDEGKERARGFVKTVLLSALWLAVATNAWSFAVAWSGLYVNPWLANGVIGLQFVGLGWILRSTVRRGYGYLQQVGVGFAVFALLAVVNYPAALFQLKVVSPDYVDVLAADFRGRVESTARFTPEETDRKVAAFRSNFWPERQARLAVWGTLMTGGVFAPLLGLVFRSRAPRSREDAGAAYEAKT